MIHQIYQTIPLHINETAFFIGSFSIRWYSLSYIVGFFVAYLLLRIRISKGENFSKGLPQEKSCALVEDYILYAFFSALLGGRLGYALFYNFSYFKSYPLEIFWPFQATGGYVGIYGMSYFGAIVAIAFMTYAFCKAHKLNFFSFVDFIVVAAPAGYFFGRLGNFFNSELYGKATDSLLGMYFKIDPLVLRHPSQLYEAILEGLLLFLILWFFRGKKTFTGQLLSIYLIGYGIARYVSELFRAPDLGIAPVFFESTGKIFSMTLVIIGIFSYTRLQKSGNKALQ